MNLKMKVKVDVQEEKNCTRTVLLEVFDSVLVIFLQNCKNLGTHTFMQTSNTYMHTPAHKRIHTARHMGDDYRQYDYRQHLQSRFE